jgi:transposase-like protein
MSDDHQSCHATGDADRDPLTTIIAWRDRWRAYGRGARGASMTIDVLTAAIDEIVRLRERLEVSERRHAVLTAIALGRRGTRR